jgi:hypothetical protein
MSVASTLRKLKLPIDWATLRLAWQGVGGRRLVSLEEVAKVAEEHFDTCTPQQLPWVAELATARDAQTVADGLAAFAPDVASPRAARKLVCALLDERLSTLSQDPIDGAAALSDFWTELGPPTEHPHVFQGVGNTITPAEYYTADNLQKLVALNREWLSKEVEALRRESEPPL